MSLSLQKFGISVLAISAATALSVSVAFATVSSPSCYTNYSVEEIKQISFEAEVVPTGGVEYKINALIASDCELDYSVVGSSVEDVMEVSIEELNESPIRFNRTVKRSDLEKKIYDSKDKLVRYFSGYSDYDDGDIESIDIFVGPRLVGGVYESDVFVVFEDREELKFDMTTNSNDDEALRESVVEILQFEYQMKNVFDESDLDQYTDISYQLRDSGCTDVVCARGDGDNARGEDAPSSAAELTVLRVQLTQLIALFQQLLQLQALLGR